MKSNEERLFVEDEKSVNGTKCTWHDVMPKLRKNKRLEKRWGQKYYTAVKEAVFMFRANPQMPVEPPISVREEADDCQPLYACQQCKDCFRFPSSFEAHNSRRSWILGYWCNNCFFVECSHVPKGQLPCIDCQAINRQSTISLRGKGLRKGRKMGSIKIFYNQCQFFAHLRKHNTSIVDMSDVMLMPLPADVDKDSHLKLEQLCETIMERMFLSRTHIMDWLRSQQLGNKWWSVLQSRFENNEGPLAELLAGKGGPRGGKKSTKRFAQPNKISNNGLASPGSSSATYPFSSDTSSISETIEAVIAQSTKEDAMSPTKDTYPKMPPLTSITYIDPLEPTEDDDNPCTTADIAFVDCGPAARTFPADVDNVLPAKKQDQLSIFPKRNTSCSSHIKVRPVKLDSHPPVRSRPPIILKQRPADKVFQATSTSNSVSASQRPFESKISVKKFAIERLKSSPFITCQKSSPGVNNQSPQTLRKLAPAPKVKTTLPSLMQVSRIETAKASVVQTSLSSLVPKIVTVHGSKSTELSKIISQLPPDVINGKKIVFIGQDTERFTILPKNDTPKSNLGVIKIASAIDEGKIIQTRPAKIAPKILSNTGSEQNMRLALDTSQKSLSLEKLKPKVQPVFLDGKVIYQNGKKFIIRHTRKPIPESTVCNNINNLKLQTIRKRVTLSSFLSKPNPPATTFVPIATKPVGMVANKRVSPMITSPFTSASTSPSPSSSPSPSLSPSRSIPEDPIGLQSKASIEKNLNDAENVKKSANSSNSLESQSFSPAPHCNAPRHLPAGGAVEYFSIEENAAGKPYVDLSKGKELHSAQSGNYKLQNYRPLSARRIKQQIEHLKDVNREYSKMLNVTEDPRILANRKFIEELENDLKDAPLYSDKDQDIDQGTSEEDINAILLSSEEPEEAPWTCATCNRSVVSESHVLGSSNKSVKNPSCRNCENYVCHICDIFQGNLSRFRAHLNFHAQKAPFTCPECFRKLPSFHRLESHVWTACFHLWARRWFKCRVCQVEGFLNMESVTKHFILTHSRLKLACPECGILSKSLADFQTHCTEDHPKVTTQLKPVNLMVCDIGHCVVRLENYRSHMDHHTAVTSMLYYKCSFCPFILQAVKGTREQIRSHLYTRHIHRLYELGFDGVRLDHLKQSFPAEDNPQNEFSTSTLQSDKGDEGKEVVEAEQGSNLSECGEKNAGAISTGDTGNISQTEDESPSHHLNAKLNNKIQKDGVECSVWSINLDHTESPESEEIMSTVQEDGHTSNNVMSEYSSSPKIFDVRSVTPDSYAEFGAETNEELDVREMFTEGTASDGAIGVTTLESCDHVTFSESETKESLLMKIGGEQSLPVKLPQVVVIDGAETDVNLTEMLQATWPGVNTFVKLSDLTKSDAKAVTSNVVGLVSELTDKGTDVSGTKESAINKTVYALTRPPGPDQCEKIIVGSTTVRKLPAPSSERQHKFPVSLLKSKNSSVEIEGAGLTNSVNGTFDSRSLVPDDSAIATDTLSTCERNTRDWLPCNVPKPPPLSRIPQRVLEESQVSDEDEEEEEEDMKKVVTPKCMIRVRQGQKRPWRIALNGPFNSSKLVHYNCHLCGEFINTSWSVLRNHFKSRHSQDYELAKVTPRLLRMSSDFISDGYMDVLGPKKRKSDGTVSNSKRKRRWTPKKHVEQHPLGPGLCVRQESIQDGEGNFVCKKCDHQCNDITSLRTHIGTHHRIKDHYLVCLECGENFVVEPSLQMHLKAFHSIQDPSSYLAENTAYAKNIIETLEDESNTGIANQCHVCMAVFEDKLAVDKHLRVHGMAFLNRKRIEALNAARNPEKKVKVDKPDENLAEVARKDEKLDNLKLGKIESVNGAVREC